MYVYIETFPKLDKGLLAVKYLVFGSISCIRSKEPIVFDPLEKQENVLGTTFEMRGRREVVIVNDASDSKLTRECSLLFDNASFSSHSHSYTPLCLFLIPLRATYQPPFT